MFWKLFWPTVRKNCCSHWDFFQIIAILCLSVSKNNFGNKIPFLNAIRTNNLDVKIYRIIYKKYLFCFFILGAKTTAKKRGKFANSSGLFQHGIHTHQTCSKNSQISSHFEWAYKSKLCILFNVRIFWEGHKVLQNLHLTFVNSTYRQKKGEEFAEFCGLLRIYEL